MSHEARLIGHRRLVSETVLSPIGPSLASRVGYRALLIGPWESVTASKKPHIKAS